MKKSVYVMATASLAFAMCVSCAPRDNRVDAGDAYNAESGVIDEEVAVEDNVDPVTGVLEERVDSLMPSEYNTTPSGLQYKVLKRGTGKRPTATSLVTVNYEGTLTDGTKFDSSYDRGQDATFPLNRVIPGWTEGLQLMREGAVYEFYIPWELAYGEAGNPPVIPPKADLKFTVELIEVQ